MSFKLSIGKVAITDEPMYSNEAIMAFCDKHKIELLPEYIYYLFQAINWDVGTNKAVMGKTLNKASLSQKKIIIDDIERQHQIVKRLDTITNIIYKKKEEIDKLDTLIKARFVEMFGAPSKVEKLANAQIKDVASIQVGVVIKPTRFYSNDGGTKAFRSLNIEPFDIRSNSDWVYFTDRAMEENRRTIVHTGDVLIVRSGNPGTCCVVPEEYDGCNVVDLIIAHPNTQKILPEYLCAFTNLPHGMLQINNQQHGVAQRHFNVSMYENMKIIVPKISEQRCFVNFLKQVDKSKSAIQKSLNETQILFDSFMQKYFG